MQTEAKADALARLNRIEGQVRGIARMVEGERYCIDVVTQVEAVRAALKRVQDTVLKDHAAHCVARAMAGGSKRDQREKIAELMGLIERLGR